MKGIYHELSLSILPLASSLAWVGNWPQPPDLVYAYIEMTPFDHIKYEVDKTTGYLR